MGKAQREPINPFLFPSREALSKKRGFACLSGFTACLNPVNSSFREKRHTLLRPTHFSSSPVFQNRLSLLLKLKTKTAPGPSRPMKAPRRKRERNLPSSRALPRKNEFGELSKAPVLTSVPSCLPPDNSSPLSMPSASKVGTPKRLKAAKSSSARSRHTTRGFTCSLRFLQISMPFPSSRNHP